MACGATTDLINCLIKLGVGYLVPFKWELDNSTALSNSTCSSGDEEEKGGSYLSPSYTLKMDEVNKMYIAEKAKTKLLDLNSITLDLITAITRVHDVLAKDASMATTLLHQIHDALGDIMTSDEGFGKEITAMVKENNNTKRRLDEYRVKCETLSKTLDEERKRGDDAECKVTLLNNEMEELKQEMEDIRDDANEKEVESRRSYEAFLKYVFSLRTQLRDNESMISKLEGEVDDLSSSLHTLRQDLAEEYANMEEARREYVEEKEGLNDTIRRLMIEKEEDNGKISTLQLELANTQDRLDQTHDNIQALEKEIKELTIHVHDVKTTEASLREELRNVTTQLDDRSSKMRSLESNLRGEVDTVNKLRMMLNDIEAHTIIMEDELNSRRDEGRRLLALEEELSKERNTNLQREASSVERAERSVIKSTYSETSYLRKALEYSNDRCQALERELDGTPEPQQQQEGFFSSSSPRSVTHPPAPVVSSTTGGDQQQQMMMMMKLSPQESSYYATIWQLAGPDMGDYISGPKAASVLQLSGLSRNTLHQIWAIADRQQQGKLDQNEFNMVCRLIAHMQSGASSVDPSLLNLEPASLPIFDGLFNNMLSSSTTIAKDQQDATPFDNQPSATNVPPSLGTTEMRPKDAAKLAMSMKDLGMDPLDFVPRTSHLNEDSNKEESDGPATGGKSKTQDKWALTDEDKQKYSSLFLASDPKRSGYISGKVGRSIFEKSKLSKQTLSLLWELADQDKDGKLNLNEFMVAMQLISKCKKGYAVPATLPKSLQDLIGESIPVRSLVDKLDDDDYKQHHHQPTASSSPTFGNRNDDATRKPTPTNTPGPTTTGYDEDADYWKYMPANSNMFTTSLQDKDGNRVPVASGICLESAVEEDKRLSKELTESIDAANEELQHIMDMCGQLEVENSRLNVDVQVKESQLKYLQRQTDEDNEELDRVNKQRREVNLEQISLRRDRAHLEAEIKHLQSLLDDGTASVTLLSQQQMQLQHQVEAIQAQTRQLDQQRREAAEEHKAEVSRLKEEQVQTSAVISDYSQLKRDEVETAKQNATKKSLNDELTVLNTKPDTDKFTNSGIERDLPPSATSGNRQWIDQVTRSNKGVPSAVNKEQLQPTPKSSGFGSNFGDDGAK
ncbi:hypothetical protein FOL46_003270 [Perkinsus olseni]|uniref:Epidermal growth factor receptor substrate 15-like 1 n=1 Tax=Perkinsus olseni TaxID=32597 RepID=A0A7J6M3Q9_PEROL|nr:hypothetical protein FOL46_003270 [Perkinsus olseni]